MARNIDLEWTGERFLPGIGGDIALEHYHRYAFARELARNIRVLDIACGDGYGASMMAEVAEYVVGIDIDPNTIAHAGATYRRLNLAFRQGSCTNIDLPDSSIDLAVSFETLEHHYEHDAMMSELRRILKPDGILVISTPDKRNYSDIQDYHNPFHIRELYSEEFYDLIRRHFYYTVFLGQKVIHGSILVPIDRAGRFLTFSMEQGAIQAQASLNVPRYLLAIGSANPIASIPISLFDATSPHVHELNRLRQELQVAQDLLAGIHSSAYWRLAAPVRWARKLLRQFRSK